MVDVDVLVVGAGPVGLTAAAELRRHGVDCRIVDRMPAPAQFAKAVGIQPRTLEIWESMGLVSDVLDLATPLRGQLVFVNGRQVARTELTLPPEVPYGFAALPQYDTERMLARHLARWGTIVERGVELTSFEQDHTMVRAHVRKPYSEELIRARYLVGCDGAHSIVRQGLGCTFDGDAFAEQYMLGDVEVDWDMPPGYSIRALHQTDGRTDDLLVCVPLPGHNRYRMSMLVPSELTLPPAGGDGVAHGLQSGRVPELRHIQAVLDRLAPRSTVASRLRWSSVFRISHRLVDRYSRGRVFLAGDAAHIHPPTGAQGMNTGIQDAYNLAWKLALAVHGAAAAGLLDSYHAERLPIGAEVVGRTVRHARTGIEADPDDPATVVLREAQLLLGYRGSPIVGPGGGRSEAGPAPGDRAPDCGGLRRGILRVPVRLFELLKDHRHTLLLYAEDSDQLAMFGQVAVAACKQAHGLLDVHPVLAADLDPDRDADPGAPGRPRLPVVHDALGQFRTVYGARGGQGYLVRPDGYLGWRGDAGHEPGLSAHLAAVFAPVPALVGAAVR